MQLSDISEGQVLKLLDPTYQDAGHTCGLVLPREEWDDSWTDGSTTVALAISGGDTAHMTPEELATPSVEEEAEFRLDYSVFDPPDGDEHLSDGVAVELVSYRCSKEPKYAGLTGIVRSSEENDSGAGIRYYVVELANGDTLERVLFSDMRSLPTT